jgi:hypothetical protein
MKIRSITYFFNPGWPLDELKFRAAGEFLKEAKARFESAGYEVQTIRLATGSFAALLGGKRLNETVKFAQAVEAAMQKIDVAYAAIGPATMDLPHSYRVIPEAIAATKNIFFSGEMASVEKGISLEAINACAEIIVKCAPITPDGFANLRFAALANVKAGSPFFPAAYHDGGEPAFAIATEAADLAVEAFAGAHTLDDGRRRLIESLERHAKQLVGAADLLKFKFNARFGGIDFSLAPFPDEQLSLGGAMERLGVRSVGLHGSLAAAAIIAEAIDRAQFPHTGFSGLLLPVLEDAVLAKRAAEGTLTIKDLLLYSAVCGTGLDTVPLPGDVTREQIAALLLDLATLGVRLNKPLTARLMPVPGKRAGEATGFDFAFFANSKVMPLDAQPLKPPFNGDETFLLRPRNS